MKNLTTHKSNFYLILLLVGLISSCALEDLNTENIKLLKSSDDELIEAISSSSNKIIINSNKLPNTAKTIIESDYSLMDIKTVFEEPSLGYEVEMTGITNANLSLTNKTYFSKNGRELTSKKNKFKFVFPVSFTMPDGSSITGKDNQDLRIQMKTWHEANPSSKEKGKLVFPVDLDFGDRTVAINNEEEMKALLKKLGGKKLKRKPFKFVFPVSFTMPDGSSITGKDNQDLRIQMKTWHEANPSSKEKGKLVFPVDLDFGDRTVTINNEEEMKTLIEKLKSNKSTSSRI